MDRAHEGPRQAVLLAALPVPEAAAIKRVSRSCSSGTRIEASRGRRGDVLPFAARAAARSCLDRAGGDGARWCTERFPAQTSGTSTPPRPPMAIILPIDNDQTRSRLLKNRGSCRWCQYYAYLEVGHEQRRWPTWDSCGRQTSSCGAPMTLVEGRRTWAFVDAQGHAIAATSIRYSANCSRSAKERFGGGVEPMA